MDIKNHPNYLNFTGYVAGHSKYHIHVSKLNFVKFVNHSDHYDFVPEELEICSNPSSLYYYAGEDSILKDAYWSYQYARSVIKARWPEAETEISKDPEISYYYAGNVIKARWPEAEPIIMQSDEWFTAYKLAFGMQ